MEAIQEALSSWLSAQNTRSTNVVIWRHLRWRREEGKGREEGGRGEKEGEKGTRRGRRRRTLYEECL